MSANGSISISGSMALTHLGRFSKLAAGDVDKFLGSHSDGEFVARLSGEDTTSEDELKEVVGRRYFTQLGYTARPRDIAFSTGTPIQRVRASRFSSSDQMMDVTNRTLQTAFVDVWGEYVGERWVEATIQAVQQTITLDSSLAFMIGDKVVGMIYHYPAHDCLGTDLTQVGWVWIDETLPKEARREIRSLVATYLSEMEVDNFQAGIHLYNVASQRFFESIGFKLTCAHILNR